MDALPFGPSVKSVGKGHADWIVRVKGSKHGMAYD